MVDIPKLKTFEIKLHPTGVAEIIFNRPERYNALSSQVYADWLEAIKWAAHCDDAKVTVITGRGKYYSSGKELTMPESFPKSASDAEKIAWAKEGSKVTRSLVEELINFPKLIIAAINGPAIGFGVTSLALCDAVYSVPSATFKTPFMQLAFCAEGCSSYLFPKIMGPSRANEMLLMGRQFTAQELEKASFISQIIPEENFHEQVIKLAADAAQFSLEALKTTKKLVRDVDRELLLKVNNEEFDRLAERRISQESRDSILKFFEEAKRKKQLKKQQSSRL
jgi:peroxisomal 3,2-trans-enoyl-CoA isomerase